MIYDVNRVVSSGVVVVFLRNVPVLYFPYDCTIFAQVLLLLYLPSYPLDYNISRYSTLW